MAGPFGHIQVIVNPAAGGAETVLKTLNQVFREHSVHWDVSVTHGPGDGRRLAQQAATNGADLIAACGGDGTLAEVASGLAGTNIPLAFLPGGTGNVMASELGVPRQIKKAAELIFQPDAQPRPIDLGQINDTPQGMFMLRASVGFEAAIVQRTTREMKDRFGLLAYGLALLDSLAKPLHARYHLMLDGEAVEAEGFSLMIANAGSIGRLNLVLGSSVHPADGLLDVMLLNNRPESMLSMAASAIQLDEFTAALQHWQVREVQVVTKPMQGVQLDGDLYDSDTPITARIVPGAVNVIVPLGHRFI